MYEQFPGKLVTCISYENYVYRLIKGVFMLGFFSFFLIFFYDLFVLFCICLFLNFDNRLISNFISFCSVLRI